MNALGTHRPALSPRLIYSVTGSQLLLASACRHSTFLAIPCSFPSTSRGKQPIPAAQDISPCPVQGCTMSLTSWGPQLGWIGGAGTPVQSSRCCPDLHSATVQCHPPLFRGGQRLWRYFLLQYLLNLSSDRYAGACSIQHTSPCAVLCQKTHSFLLSLHRAAFQLESSFCFRLASPQRSH